ncbi:Peroxisomal membrane protein PAS20 [Tulasnella sp. 408]|nr:Peroxisomal membrane protein PAS20 [Tulasnella sp. 408]
MSTTTMPAPPKPWERSGSVVASSTTQSVMQSAQPAPAPAPTTTTSTTTPAVPQRPASLSTTSTAVAPVTASPYASMTSSYSSPYSTYGAGSSYLSPYNRMGGYGSYGSYGGGYGGYGGYGGGYGMSPYGMGGMGVQVDPATGQPVPSLIQQAESSTGQTFALIQSIVGTFTGFANMLESTFMATHSSFFAMLGVAEQFGQLKVALGQVFGLFGFVGWLRGWLRGDRAGLKRDFKKFLKGEEVPGQSPRPSRKPLVIFLLAIFGLPFLMRKLILHLASRLPPPVPVQVGPDGQPRVIDPNNLTFVRAIHPFASKDPVELALSKGELVAVLSTVDPATGVEGEWWRGRTREGREGWFPANFVEIVKSPAKKLEAAPISTPAPGKKID